MKSPTNGKAHTVRNLIIFVAGVIALPWLGWSLDVGRGAAPHNQQNSLGWLLFIIGALLATARSDDLSPNTGVDGSARNGTALPNLQQ